jgi:hypothetical protein
MLVSAFCLFQVRGSMRQILIGAWLVVASSAIAACNGEEFASGSAASDDEASSGAFTSTNKGGSGGRGSGGSSATNAGSSSGGKATTGGGSTVVPTGGSAPGGGGTSAAGGSSPSGGSGPTDDVCPEGKVTFKMVPSLDIPPGYLCDASCGTGWLTITDAEGASAFSLFSACGTASCESCEALPCAAAACLPEPLTAEGRQLSWTGTYLEQDTCGAKLACQRQACAPPGKYRAKACVSVSAGSSDVTGGCVPKDGIMLCAEHEFDFPSNAEIELKLTKN